MKAKVTIVRADNGSVLYWGENLITVQERDENMESEIGKEIFALARKEMADKETWGVKVEVNVSAIDPQKLIKHEETLCGR